MLIRVAKVGCCPWECSGCATARSVATFFNSFTGVDMRIFTDKNGVAVNAIAMLGDGTNVEGHCYQVLAGTGAYELNFQHGGVADHGVNGLTTESLLAIAIHRTKFLNAQFPCHENLCAIAAMETALGEFEARTASRELRGVEGKEAA